MSYIRVIVDTVSSSTLCSVMRVTRRLVQLAQALMDDPQGKHWGYQLMQDTGVPSGVIYPLLTRMLDEGWVRTRSNKTGVALGPSRTYYVVTAKGRKELATVLDSAKDKGKL